MNEHPKIEKEANVFRNGRSQAVRIPKEFEFATEKVLISKDDDGVLHMRPKVRKRTPAEILEWFAARGPVEEDFPAIEDLPPEPVDLDAQ
jgi:antitoxin VapB